MRSKGLSGLAAVVAGMVGLALAHVLAVFTRPSASPVAVVGAAFIDVVPPWLKNIAIALFGMFDKVALLAGIGLVLGVLLAVLGGWARNRPGIVYAGLIVLTLVPAGLTFTRAELGPADALPSLVCGLVACLAFAFFRARMPAPAATAAAGAATLEVPAPEKPTDEIDEQPRPSRRGFLTLLGVTAAVSGAVAGGVQLFTGLPRRIADFRRGVVIPAPADVAPPPPVGIDPPVAGLTPYRTSIANFYRVDTALVVPRVDPETWRLRITGEVENEVELTFDELINGRLIETWVTLTCVSNLVGGGLAGNAIWTGLPVRDVLALARPLPGADMVLSTSVDGWTASTPLEVLTDPERDALLAVTMNGEPLPIEHGFPVRMVVPGLYGYVSATKWVTELEVTRFTRRVAYWSLRGWSPQGPIKTASRIDVPQDNARVPAGQVAVAGVAWAQHRGIQAVEVQVDDGPWQQAVLAPTVGPDTWRQWTYLWSATPGRHQLRVRATDGTGDVQTSVQAGTTPDGATGWHTVFVTVV